MNFSKCFLNKLFIDITDILFYILVCQANNNKDL